MSRSIHGAQGEPLPYNHHLHQFLTFLKHERGFADATIVNRERSLKPFLGWLVAEDVPLSTVSPVVITKYFTGIVAVEADHRLVPCTVAALVFSLCQQSRLVRGGHRRVHRRTPGLHVRKSAARAGVGTPCDSLLPSLPLCAALFRWARLKLGVPFTPTGRR
jgi:hypothetical protein